jgi:hypothetical protein
MDRLKSAQEKEKRKADCKRIGRSIVVGCLGVCSPRVHDIIHLTLTALALGILNSEWKVRAHRSVVQACFVSHSHVNDDHLLYWIKYCFNGRESSVRI